MSEQNENKGLSLPVAILVAALIIGGVIIYAVGKLNSGQQAPTGGNQAQGTTADLSQLLKVSGRDVILGDQNAPVTFIEYGDYQCPFCASFYRNTEALLRQNYVSTGKIRMIFRDLAFLGPESQAAGEAAECAKDQGKFWAYHDALYETELAEAKVTQNTEGSGNLNRDLLVKLAKDGKLDVPAFTSCYDSRKYAQAVKDVTKQANDAGINATPTSFVNGKQIQGAQPYSVFQQAIDSAEQ